MRLAVLPAAARRLFAPIVPLLGCGQRHVFLGRHDVQEYSMDSLYLPSFHTRTGTGRWLEIINRILLRNAIHAKRFLLYRKCDTISYKAKKGQSTVARPHFTSYNRIIPALIQLPEHHHPYAVQSLRFWCNRRYDLRTWERSRQTACSACLRSWCSSCLLLQPELL